MEAKGSKDGVGGGEVWEVERCGRRVERGGRGGGVQEVYGQGHPSGTKRCSGRRKAATWVHEVHGRGVGGTWRGRGVWEALQEGAS